MMHASPLIVCGTDFSENARLAADVAAALSLRLKGRLAVAHVAEDTAAHADTPTDLERYLRPRERMLRNEVKRLRETGAAVEGVLLKDRWAEDALLGYIRTHPTALVVVSSVSKTTFDRWTLGSVSEKLTQGAPCPTLVIRKPKPFVAWAKGNDPLRIFVAADFSESSDAVLRWVGELRKVGPCSVTVGHVNWPPEERRALGLTGALPLTSNPPRVRRALERDLHKKVGELIGEDDVRILVRPSWGRADAPLLEMAEEARADVIVVGAHQRHGLNRLWHGSVSRGLLHHAPGNVVCVPGAAPVPRRDGHFPHFNLILVATDFSATSNTAIPYAYAILPRGGVVKLIHVIAPWEPPGPLVAHYERRRLTQKQHHRLVAKARRQLRELIPHEAGAHGIVTEAEIIEHRDPAIAIREEAERAGADVICMASHGRSGVSKAMFGSVAQAVMKRGHRPVLIIRAQKP